jgi:hypothetical protein
LIVLAILAHKSGHGLGMVCHVAEGFGIEAHTVSAADRRLRVLGR